MPSDEAKDTAQLSAPKKSAPTTPQRSAAIKRQQNAGARRKEYNPVLAVPKTAPPRARNTKAKRSESTLLGDFLLGRPSPQRPRRKSLDAVKAEINTQTISKLKSPGGVQDRVKQWQKSGGTLDDPFVTTLSDEELRGGRHSGLHDSLSPSQRNIATVTPAMPVKTKENASPRLPKAASTPTKPHKRVVSDDHWMQYKNKQKPIKTSPTENTGVKSYGLPADFLERKTVVSPLSVKIKSWNAQTVHVQPKNGERREGSVETSDQQRGNYRSNTGRHDIYVEDGSALDRNVDINLVQRGRRPLNGHEVRSKAVVPDPTLLEELLPRMVKQQTSEDGQAKECEQSLSKADDSSVTQSGSESTCSRNNESYPKTPRKSAAPAKIHSYTRDVSPDSLPEIPVGRSAFSVLDLPVGGKVRNKTAPEPVRNHSFKAVPQVLKKVYNGGKRMVQDAVDPPRPEINLPPSIESWLNATSDPFLQVTKSVHPGYEESLSPQATPLSHLDVDDNAERESEVVASFTRSGQRGLSKGLRSRSIESGVIQARDFGADSPHSSRPRRSPAARKTSHTSKVTRTPLLRGGLADAFRGQSNNTWTKSEDGSPQERIEETFKRTAQRYTGSPMSDTQDRERFQSHCATETHHVIESRQPVHSARNGVMKDAAPIDPDSHTQSTAAWNCVSTASTRSSTKNDPLSDEVFKGTSKPGGAESSRRLSRDTALTSAPRRPDSSRAVARRRSTKHSDLMTVLSLPDADTVGRSMSIRSANSVRTIRTSLEAASLDDLLHELAEDEAKYMRDLEALVNGVIPVLLSRVLSGSFNFIFSSSRGASDEKMVESDTKQHVVEIGIALERLKSLHRQIPLRDPHLLVQWASRSHAVYEAYLAAWCTDFEGIVVNLTPISDKMRSKTGELLSIPASARVNREHSPHHEGQSVDVGFLLKRPLVRIKHLARITKGVHRSMPGDDTKQLNDCFQALLAKTRRRSKEEQARREDIAAIHTDTSRVRDLRDLAPSSNIVPIASNRQVKAKDFFSMDLQHSTGQRLVCRVELIIRDEPRQGSEHGDLLMCEVDVLDRWLLFPPLELEHLSARLGASAREIVLSIVDTRTSPDRTESIILTAEDEYTALEWVQMLGIDARLTAPDRQIPNPVPCRESIRNLSEELSRTRTSSVLKELPFGEGNKISSTQRTDQLDEDGHGLPFETTDDWKHVSKGAQGHLSASGARSSGRRENSVDEPKKPVSLMYRPCLGATGVKSSYATAEARVSLTKHDPIGGQIEHHMDLLRKHPKQGSSDVQHVSLLGDDKASMTSKSDHAPSVGASPGKGSRTPKSSPLLDEVVNFSSESPIDQSEERLQYLPIPPPHKGIELRRKAKETAGSSSVSNRSSRRSSSPLKHEYHPSNASDTSSAESGSDTCSATLSDSSEDEDFDEVDLPLPPPERAGAVGTLPKFSVSSDDGRADMMSCQSSDQQWPTRDQHDVVRLIASVSCWIDKGHWEMLHPELCSVKITAGLIEVFKLSATHSPPGHDSKVPEFIVVTSETAVTDRPLVAFDLTPLVPLRQSTALDIEVRSPPLPRSSIKCTGTVRFRTRTAEDCHKFYAAIHRARLNNPIFKRLEQERILNGYGQHSGHSNLPGSKSRSWFGRKVSYRASARAPSVSTSEIQSRGSLGTAIDVLRNLGSGGGYNIDRSSVGMMHDGSLPRSGATSLHTSSAGSVSSGVTPPRTPMSMSMAESSIATPRSRGTRNMKIRLYRLDTAASWTDMGACRITIEDPPPGQRQASTLYSGIPHLVTVTSKKLDARMDTKESTQLDPRRLSFGNRRMSLPAAMGPKKPEDDDEGQEDDYHLVLRTIIGGNSILRQNRTGIAINIWEEMVGPNGEVGMVSATGGVGGRTRKWMFQFGSAQETAWVYAVLGGR